MAKRETGISLKALYMEGVRELSYGGYLVKDDVEEENYELIVNNDVSSYDGEVCVIIEQNDKYAILRNEQGEEDKEFVLTAREFGIATFNQI